VGQEVRAEFIDDEVTEALKICGGDAMAALRITLIANAFLEAQIDELKEQISSGYARGKVRTTPKIRAATTAARSKIAQGVARTGPGLLAHLGVSADPVWLRLDQVTRRLMLPRVLLLNPVWRVPSRIRNGPFAKATFCHLLLLLTASN